MRRAQLTTLALAAVGVLSGCSGEEADGVRDAQEVRPSSAGVSVSSSPSAPTSTPPSSDPTSADVPSSTAPTRPILLPQDLDDDPGARRTLRSAFGRLFLANTGSYAVTSEVGGTSIRDRGRYQFEPVRSDSTRSLTSTEGSLRLTYRTVGQSTWFRLVDARSPDNPSGNSWPCWAPFPGPELVSDYLGAPAGPGPAGQPPAALVAASYAVGREPAGDGTGDIIGTTDLALVLGLLDGTRAVTAAALGPDSTDKVVARFRIQDGTLAGFDVAFPELFAAIEAAGIDLPLDLAQAMAAGGRLTVDFTDVGDEVAVSPPPPAEVVGVGLEDSAGFEEAMRACG